MAFAEAVINRYFSISSFFARLITSIYCILDIWWLVWAVFLVAIIERANIMDESRKWFDLFRVLFELVSAFGGIGLSLGLPNVCILLNTTPTTL